jgi:hypothetical protein
MARHTPTGCLNLLTNNFKAPVVCTNGGSRGAGSRSILCEENGSRVRLRYFSAKLVPPDEWACDPTTILAAMVGGGR